MNDFNPSLCEITSKTFYIREHELLNLAIKAIGKPCVKVKFSSKSKETLLTIERLKDKLTSLGLSSEEIEPTLLAIMAERQIFFEDMKSAEEFYDIFQDISNSVAFAALYNQNGYLEKV